MLSGCSEWGGEEKTVSCIGYCRLRFKDCGSNTCTQLMSMDLFAASSEVYKGSRIFPASCFPLEDLSNTFPKFNLCPCRLTDSYFEDRMIPYCRQSKLMDLYHKFLSSSVLHSITGWILSVLRLVTIPDLMTLWFRLVWTIVNVAKTCAAFRCRLTAPSVQTEKTTMKSEN